MNLLLLKKNHICLLTLLGIVMIGSSIQAQTLLKGNVRDTEAPMPGVSILIEGTAKGTITDINGSFEIYVSRGETISFSFMGYETYHYTYDGTENNIQIQLLAKTEDLEELVVIGYGVQKKKDLTGAVGVVSVDEMQKQQSPNLGHALQGQVAGVTVTTNGQPGSGADIRIRGIGSFSSVGPLYVVDGMILSGQQREFNVNDVESVQVLKDASATALYGARGANGVIIITTKKGHAGEPQVKFSANYGVQQIAHRIDMMNSMDFLRLNRTAYENAGMVWPGEPSYGDTLVNTNWQDEFFEIGSTQDYNLTVSGGSETAHYLISTNMYQQNGVVYGPEYKRYNLRVNTEMKKGRLTIGENFLMGRTYTTPMNGSPFIDLVRMPPVIPVYDENNESGYGYGSNEYQTYGSNPIGLQDNLDRLETGNRIFGNIYAELEIFSFLKYRVNAGLEYFNWHDRDKMTYNTIRYLSASSYDNKLTENRGDFSSYLLEHTLSFNKVFDEHQLDALIGYTSQETIGKSIFGSVYDVVNGYWVLNSGDTEVNTGGSDYENAMISWLGRINYQYKNRYLFQFNVRRDGSSKFGVENRYGNFPSGSFGWRISEEDFFSGAKNFINNLKFRTSYGVIGDQQALGNYDYTTYINVSEGGIFGADQTYYSGAIQKGRENPYIKWETRKTFNLGLDFGLLSNKVYGTLEYFNSISSDLLVQIPLSWTDGTDITPWTNYGKIQNNGIEFNLGYKNKIGDLFFNIDLNLTTINTTVLELGDSFREAGINNVNRSEEGRSIGDFYVIKTDGIFQNWEEIYSHTSLVTDSISGESSQVVIQSDAKPGDIRYQDFNEDGTIDAEDRQYIGSPLPKFETALRFSGTYKQFDFVVFLTGVYGNLIYNEGKFWLERMDDVANYPEGLEPWTEENQSQTTPRALIGPNDNAKAITDRWIEDGSYIRLKNLQVGYTLPGLEKLNKLGFQNFRCYAGVQNLFTITNYSGFDPEISGGSVFGKGNDTGHFPPVRTFLLGLQMTF